MSLCKSISFAIITALTCSAPGAQASADAPRCSLGHYPPLTSQPYRVQYESDFGTYSILYGARLYIPAQPGLTREWLMRDLMQALAQPTQQGDACRAPLQGVQVDVVSAGPGFWVLLRAADERHGAELVRWASGLAPQASASVR